MHDLQAENGALRELLKLAIDMDNLRQRWHDTDDPDEETDMYWAHEHKRQEFRAALAELQPILDVEGSTCRVADSATLTSR